MKKLTLVLMIISACLCCFSCSHKMHANMMAKAPLANSSDEPMAMAPSADNQSYVPFTKAKMQQLQNSNADPRQLQFYVDQKIVLRRMSASGNKAMVKGGAIVTESNHSSDELVIPAMTPVICDRVSGDSLMVSFEAGNNDIPFGAILGSNTYSVLGSNWINGSADVTYNNATYRIICGSCSNVAEVRLMVKETSVDKANNANKTIVGRKLYK